MLCDLNISHSHRPTAVHALALHLLPVPTAGSRLLTVPNVSDKEKYPMKLKGIAICFSMLRAALSGHYVNFGVFHLYGDDALDRS